MTVGGKLGCTLAQALSSSGSSVSVSARLIDLLICIMDDLIQCGGPPPLSFPRVGFGLARGRLEFADLLGVLLARLGVVPLLASQSHSLGAGEHQCEHQPDARDLRDSAGGQVGDHAASTFCASA